MKHYCCGFLFDDALDTVLLIEKKHPDFMVGLLNGVGGSIEDGETPAQAMLREGEEEVGVLADWRPFAIIVVAEQDAIVYFFRARSTELLHAAHQCEEEMPFRVSVAILIQQAVVENLRWLVPMAATRTIQLVDGTCTWTPEDWWGE